MNFRIHRIAVTPNSSLDTPISSNNNSGSNHIKGSTIISADSSVASSISLDEEEESPTKVKKKDEHHVSVSFQAIYHSNRMKWLDNSSKTIWIKSLQNQVLKKEMREMREMPIGNAKNSFYNNFEIQSRRGDITTEQFSLPPNLVSVQATPSPPVSNNSAIHSNSFGPTQILMKQNANNAKNRFANANAAAAAADTYYGSGGGYFGKQGGNPGVDYYGKYEVEFAGHHQQKGVVPPNQIAPFNQPSKVDFAETKPPTAEFHHVVKGELHHNIKPEFIQQQQQQHHKNIEFHHGKAGPPPIPPPPPNFHLNHQNFYNHHGPHAANVDGVHQQSSPMQYNANQYFPNEYGGANDLDASAAYYEHKAASAQQSYYENMYNNSGSNAAAAAAAAEFHGVNNAAYGTPSNGQLPGEHCDSFLYPQYFEGGNHHEPNVTVSMQAQAQIHNHIAPGHNLTHQNQHYNHGIGNPHYHAAQHNANGHPHISASPMDNSNSSSDFNFLSNIANDFAPEYYQLS